MAKASSSSVLAIGIVVLLISIFFIVVAAFALQCYDATATNQTCTYQNAANVGFVWVGVGIAIFAIVMAGVLIGAGAWYKRVGDQSAGQFGILKTTVEGLAGRFVKGLSIAFSVFFILIAVYFIAVCAIGIQCINANDLPQTSPGFIIMAVGLAVSILMIILMGLNFWAISSESAPKGLASAVQRVLPNVLNPNPKSQ